MGKLTPELKKLLRLGEQIIKPDLSPEKAKKILSKMKKIAKDEEK
jgi:hypothetical protein